MLAGAILKGRSLKGYIENGLVDLSQLKRRHIQLATELTARNYNHSSPLPDTGEVKGGKVDVIKNLRELKSRCVECQNRIESTLF